MKAVSLSTPVSRLVCPGCPRIGYGLAFGYDVQDWYNTIRDSQIEEPMGNAEAIADQVGRERSKPDVQAGSRRRRGHDL
jgi:hypothetical protein